MRNDGVDIQACTDGKTNGFEVFDINDGEWLLFTVSVEKTGTYNVEIRYANSGEAGLLYLEKDGKKVSQSIPLNKIGDEPVYGTVTLKNISLEVGTHQIKVVFEKGGFQLNYLDFVKQ